LNILYNKAVNSINYSGTSVSISTTDGSSYTAKKVIVTVPLAILKEDSITFTPSLPLSNRLAITLLGAGVMDKLILEFD
jgi:monoamine oxidase